MDMCLTAYEVDRILVVTVVVTDTFEAWARTLPLADRKSLARAIGLLEARGVSLGFPYSSAIAGTEFALRELRVQSKGKPIRVIYAFDPWRQAVLLLGADKTGRKRSYQEAIREAERIWQAYLEEHDDGEE